MKLAAMEHKCFDLQSLSPTHCNLLLLLVVIYCGGQEEPTILISSLLLPMRHMYVAAHSFGLQLRKNGMYRTQFDHACLDLLSLVI